MATGIAVSASVVATTVAGPSPPVMAPSTTLTATAAATSVAAKKSHFSCRRSTSDARLILVRSASAAATRPAGAPRPMTANCGPTTASDSSGSGLETWSNFSL
jgi:hypothetical protein